MSRVSAYIQIVGFLLTCVFIFGPFIYLIYHPMSVSSLVEAMIEADPQVFENHLHSMIFLSTMILSIGLSAIIFVKQIKAIFGGSAFLALTVDAELTIEDEFGYDAKVHRNQVMCVRDTKVSGYDFTISCDSKNGRFDFENIEILSQCGGDNIGLELIKIGADRHTFCLELFSEKKWEWVFARFIPMAILFLLERSNFFSSLFISQNIEFNYIEEYTEKNNMYTFRVNNKVGRFASIIRMNKSYASKVEVCRCFNAHNNDYRELSVTKRVREGYIEYLTPTQYNYIGDVAYIWTLSDS